MQNPIPHPVVEKKSEVAEAIVDAAERLLNSYGYQKMTMTDLAAEAGIGVGTTYLHFASKADVAVAVVERIHGRMLRSLESIAASDQMPNKLLEELLLQRILAPYAYVKNKLTTMSWQQMNRQGTEFMNDVHQTNPGRIEHWRAAEAVIIAAVLKSGTECGQFLDVDPLQTAGTLLTATSGFFPKHLEQKDFVYADEFEQRVKDVIQLLINGILYQRNMDGK